MKILRFNDFGVRNQDAKFTGDLRSLVGLPYEIPVLLSKSLKQKKDDWLKVKSTVFRMHYDRAFNQKRKQEWMVSSGQRY